MLVLGGHTLPAIFSKHCSLKHVLLDLNNKTGCGWKLF